MCINICWELQRRQSWCWGAHLVQLSLQIEIQTELWVGTWDKGPWAASLWLTEGTEWHHPGEWTLRDTAGAGDSGGNMGLVWGDCKGINFFKNFFCCKSDGTLKWLALRGYGLSLKILKTCQDTVLNSLLWFTLLKQERWTRQPAEVSSKLDFSVILWI